jgi:AraC-like DNA-binding protein
VEKAVSAIPGMSVGIEILPYLRPYVRHCGAEPRGPWRIGSRRLLDYLLVYIAEGRGQFEIAGVSYEAEVNDLFWIPPDTPHAMEGYPPRMVCPYAHFDLAYRPEVSHWDFSIPAGMLDLSDLHPLLHPRPPHAALANLCGRIRSFTNRRVGELVREVCAEAYRAQPFAFLRMSGLMTMALAEILRCQAGLAGEYGRHAPALEKAALLLRDRCARDVTVEEAAEAADLSDSYFRSLFTAYFGCSPREYLRRARIDRAKRLMTGSPPGRTAGGGLTMTEIARLCGFATVHSFSHAFKGVEGISPSQYRTCGAQAATRVAGRTVPYSR